MKPSTWFSTPSYSLLFVLLSLAFELTFSATVITNAGDNVTESLRYP
jgi:hypothetical protein